MLSDIPPHAASAAVLQENHTDVHVSVTELFTGEPTGDMMPAFVCPCACDTSLDNTYASVLVVGVDGVAATLHNIRSSSLPPIANTSSYCMACRRITPSFNPSLTAEANVLHWQRKRAFYASCEQFIGTWPKRVRGTRVRHRKKKTESLDDTVPLT
jgi:hypothetical protein